MGRSLQAGNSLIVSTFHTALFHQLLYHHLGQCPLRERLQHRADGPIPQAEAAWPGFKSLHAAGPCARTHGAADPAHRIWVPVGTRRAAPAPVGDATRPSVECDPADGQYLAGRVQHVVNIGVSIWSNHPIQAASATVWIQVGLGLWLLVAPHGRWSGLGGVASAGWVSSCGSSGRRSVASSPPA